MRLLSFLSGQVISPPDKLLLPYDKLFPLWESYFYDEVVRSQNDLVIAPGRY
jgi:hypothetical protein